MAINTFNQSSAILGETVTSTVNQADLVTKIQDAGSDTYFDSTSELHSVEVYYTHEEGRQKKTIIHEGPNLEGYASWGFGARDGTWEKNKVVTYDINGAHSTLVRASIGSAEDLVMTDSTVALNT